MTVRSASLPPAAARKFLAGRAKEEGGHIAIVLYLEAILFPGYIVHHSPNEGLRSKAAAGKMIAMGTKPGWPDIEIVAPGGRLYVMEVKRLSKGELSADQQTIRKAFDENGTPYALVRTIDDAKRALRLWGIPTREAASR